MRVSVSGCLSLSVCISQCVCVCVSPCSFVSLSVSVSLTVFLCVSQCVSVFLFSLFMFLSLNVCVCVCVCVCLGVHHLIQCHWVMMSLLWVWCSESIMVCWLFIFAITEFSSAVIRNIGQVVVQDKIQVQGRLTAIFIGICGYAPKASMRE